MPIPHPINPINCLALSVLTRHSRTPTLLSMFPTTAVTNYHRHKGLTTPIYYLTVLEDWNSIISLIGLKSTTTGLCFLCIFMGKCFLAFFSFKTSMPWLSVQQSDLCFLYHISSSCASILSWPFLTLLTLLLLFIKILVITWHPPIQFRIISPSQNSYFNQTYKVSFAHKVTY